jgi:hypothetical protein
MDERFIAEIDAYLPLTGISMIRPAWQKEVGQQGVAYVKIDYDWSPICYGS